MKVVSYRELIVWQKAIALATSVYETTKTFPQSELYGLTSQMRRSAFSIPSNIAEGFCRGGKPEFRHFLQISFGSGAELETQLTIAKNIRILQEKEHSDIMKELEEIMRILNKMISNLKLIARN